MINIPSHQVKLIDYGFCEKTKGLSKDFCGTEAYMAPEVLEHKEYDKAIDKWGIGCLAYVMLTGNYIFNYEKEVADNKPGNMEVRNQIAKFSKLTGDEKKEVIKAKQWLHSTDCPKEMLDKILDIIIGLTKATPDSRLPLNEVLNSLASLLQNAGSLRGNWHPKKNL